MLVIVSRSKLDISTLLFDGPEGVQNNDKWIHPQGPPFGVKEGKHAPPQGVDNSVFLLAIGQTEVQQWQLETPEESCQLAYSSHKEM
jgi:hypothetical protein